MRTDSPILFPALLYGMATVLLPFAVLQPALGLGIASGKAEKPALARAESLATHTVFCYGLYVCAMLLVV